MMLTPLEGILGKMEIWSVPIVLKSDDIILSETGEKVLRMVKLIEGGKATSMIHAYRR